MFGAVRGALCVSPRVREFNPLSGPTSCSVTRENVLSGSHMCLIRHNSHSTSLVRLMYRYGPPEF